MSSRPCPSAHAFPADPSEDDAYYRAVLHDLIDRGADLARRLHERAAGPAGADADVDAAGPPDPTIAFDRVARAIRRTIALARHIAANPGTQAAAARGTRRTAARTALIRGVEDAIHRRRNATDTDHLVAEFTETLEDPALEFDLADRPVPELVEEICRDLGINTATRSFIFRRRTPADRAALRARAAAAPLAPDRAAAAPLAPDPAAAPTPATPRSTSPAGSALRSPRSTAPDAAATHPTGPPRSAPPPAA